MYYYIDDCVYKVHDHMESKFIELLINDKLEIWKQKFQDDIRKRKDKIGDDIVSLYNSMKISFYNDKLLDLYFYDKKYIFCFSSGEKIQMIIDFCFWSIKVYDYYDPNLYYSCALPYPITDYYKMRQRIVQNETIIREKMYGNTIFVTFYKYTFITYIERSFLGVNTLQDNYYGEKIMKRKKKWNNY